MERQLKNERDFLDAEGGSMTDDGWNKVKKHMKEMEECCDYVHWHQPAEMQRRLAFAMASQSQLGAMSSGNALSREMFREIGRQRFSE